MFTLITPIFAPMTRPRVTAGLMWHPDTWPMVWARLATVMPKQRAILTIFAWVQDNIKSVLYMHGHLVIQLGGGLCLVTAHAAAAANQDQQQAAHQLSQEGSAQRA